MCIHKWRIICALAIGLAGRLAPAWAQTSPLDSGTATAHSAESRSSGIDAIVASASFVPPGLVVEFTIQNTRKSPIYISPITSSYNGAGAMSSKGVLYTIDNNGSAVTGMESCHIGNDFNIVISECLKTFPVENMTYLEAGQSTVLGIAYRRQGGAEDTADKVSFALKFLVRNALKDTDQLSVTADKGSAAGPAVVVTLGFPRTSVTKDPQ